VLATTPVRKIDRVVSLEKRTPVGSADRLDLLERAR
jgi:hypothetical protein